MNYCYICGFYYYGYHLCQGGSNNFRPGQTSIVTYPVIQKCDDCEKKRKIEEAKKLLKENGYSIKETKKAL